MMREAVRPVEKGHGHDDLEADILAALWEQVPFPQLPLDAPSEIKDLVVNIENPKRVYSIHRASRRHNLQLLVEKFVVQLRYGCGFSACTTSSCFSCRIRVAGKAPVRRYSPTSARTLAIYLASQDNPESRLCPHIQPPTAPSDAVKPLIFSPKYPASGEKANGWPNAGSTTAATGVTPKAAAIKRVPRRPFPHREQTTTSGNLLSPVGFTKENHKKRGQSHDRQSEDKAPRDKTPAPPRSSEQLQISEEAVSKDYRSFAANVFGTVAFKMLEWLTPNSIEAMSEKVEAVDGPLNITERSRTNLSSSGDEDEKRSIPSVPAVSQLRRQDSLADVSQRRDASSGPSPTEGIARFDQRTLPEYQPASRNSDFPGLPSHSRRNSSARIRTSSVSKSHNKVMPDALLESVGDESGLKSPTIHAHQPENVSKGLVRPASTMTRTTPQLSIDNVLDTIPDERSLEPDSHTDEDQLQTDDANGDDTPSSVETAGSVDALDTLDETQDTQATSDYLESTSELDSFLPQSLSRLSLQAVNFICDVLQEDATSERHLLEPATISGPTKRSSSRLKSWKRKRKSAVSYPQDLKVQWKLFVEQSIFNVLSDPQAVLDSFTNRNGVLDSHTLWYCMLRLTRVAPSLVFDSLWIALAALFAPPKALQSTRSPTSKMFPASRKSFTNAEAASLMSVCFHALVAAVPLVTDPRQLDDMSRIRSHGLTLPGGGTVARQPTSLCLQYEDVFTDGMALRLARRLLKVIPTRRYFDELVGLDFDSEDEVGEPDVLETLLSSYLESSTQSPLNFSKAEQSMHEKRIPLLLLDWARAVMLYEWEGKPEVSEDGPFGGALSLIAAMYKKRQSLLLGEIHFRCEYFGERLDPIGMPVSWLSFTSTKQKVHLLDYPYIFSPASLVSYFRAINFSRMSRSYEESCSLQSRITAIVAAESLVTESHQKNVLQELLKVPSAKYLILDIGRGNVLRDAFDQIWRREERELLRPLKVHLGEDSGEEGFDSGGVQQEFFRLAIAEALNPDYGAFTIDERTRMTWFQPGSVQPEWKFELVGLLVSLAVYNGLTLPITFPTALYHKLLGEPVTELHHIADGWPDLANGLTNLLEWNEKDGSVEDVFVLTYEFSASMFGQPITREMRRPSSSSSSSRSPRSSSPPSWPQFSSHPLSPPPFASNPKSTDEAPLVTGDNRNAYVSDYIRYLTSVSVAPQYAAFARGFRTCLHPKSLSLLTPPLLQSIVEGTQSIDVGELRRAARYVGWDATHRAVRDFWAVVRRYDERMRRKLLEFVTASDRVPVGGMANIQFVVQRNGEEEGEGGHLPTAYTCYGTLLLPEYRDREVLRERLGMALENAQGFGFA